MSTASGPSTTLISNNERTHLYTTEELLTQYTTQINKTKNKGWFDWFPSWKPTSLEHLAQAETELLNYLQTPYTNLYVPIGEDVFIRTITMAPDTSSTADILRHPLVMVHGFGCGLGAFYTNYDHLHSKRRIFAFDALGFGRSSRIPFNTDPEVIENQFVESFEKWRQALSLDKIILLGHSLGAFMSCAYAMKYAARIQHLILVEPWGFIRKPKERVSLYRRSLTTSNLFASFMNLFTMVRLAGPYGPHLVRKYRPDMEAKLGKNFMRYVYHCNAQHPTGETAFFYLQTSMVWARRPMLERLNTLNPNVSISLIYGTRSWADISTGEKIYAIRPDSYVDVHYVKGAGHHVHADSPTIFNDIVNMTCDLVDEGRNIKNDTKTDKYETVCHIH